MDYQTWMEAVKRSLASRRPDVTIQDVDPNATFTAWKQGMSPYDFVNQGNLPLYRMRLNTPQQQYFPSTQGYYRQGGEGVAIASMVLGIVSLVFVWFWPISLPCAIIGLVLGISGRSSRGHGMAIAGIVCSLVTLSIQALLVLWFFVLLLSAASNMS